MTGVAISASGGVTFSILTHDPNELLVGGEGTELSLPYWNTTSPGKVSSMISWKSEVTAA